MKKRATILPVPSGRVVFANDLRPLTGVVKKHNVNTEQGMHNMSMEYAVYGMGFIFSGNSDPEIVRSDEGIEITTRPGDSPSLGSVSTGLWWVCAMDEQTFLRRCETMGHDPESFSPIVVDVPAGVHIMSQEDHDGDGLISRIKFIPELSVNELTFLEEPDFSTSNTFEDSMIWKSVKSMPFGRNANLQDLFTVLGNGYRWHHGQMTNPDGHDTDTPFAKKLPKSENVADLLPRIPELPGFVPGIRGMKGSCVLHEDYPKLGAAPLNADPHALALGMMFAKTFLSLDPALITGLGGDITPEEERADAEKSLSILRRELVVAGRIAEERGLFTDGTLDRIFAEALESWAKEAPATEPEETPEM